MTNEEKIEKKIIETLTNLQECKRQIESMPLRSLEFEGVQELVYIDAMIKGFNEALAHHKNFIEQNKKGDNEPLDDDSFLDSMKMLQEPIDNVMYELRPVFSKYNQPLVL